MKNNNKKKIFIDNDFFDYKSLIQLVNFKTIF